MRDLDLFPLGSRVLLRVCQHGEPGLVVSHARGKLVVEWPDLQFTARFPPESLVPVAVNRLNVAG